MAEEPAAEKAAAQQAKAAEAAKKAAAEDKGKFSQAFGPIYRAGTLEDAVNGILPLLLGDNADQKQITKFILEGEEAIKREFERGSEEDRIDFTHVCAGTSPPHHKPDDGLLWPSCKTLDELMEHRSTKEAKLEHYHVLALRLYTTSSYKAINIPMRSDPPTQPHPFAATTYFIWDGIKKLRSVEAKTDGGKKPRTLWRGLTGLSCKSFTDNFMMQGGTEFACMSTSASSQQALAFSDGLMFQYDTQNCIQRGADIAYLSVYPTEKEVLYPPLTFLRNPLKEETTIAGKKVTVIKVESQIAGN